MAIVDCGSGLYYRHGVFSVTTAKWRDGGTTASVGPGYCILYWRVMGGGGDGPEVWFWFTPFVIDTAHRGVQIYWIWSPSSEIIRERFWPAIFTDKLPPPNTALEPTPTAP